jgi:antirestriction protein
MEEHKCNDNGSGGERRPEPKPRIYVASLADYNAGRLYGSWLNADQDAESLEAAIAVMLEHSPIPGAEEWAIHDFDGFGIAWLSEYESLGQISKVACGIAEHGQSFGAWAAVCGNDEEALDRFQDVYLGSWPSLEDYAEELLGDIGLDEPEKRVPEWIRPYVTFDLSGFARDLELGGDVISVKAPDGSVWVFDGNG